MNNNNDSNGINGDKFYSLYDELSNYGRVYDFDLSAESVNKKKLLPREIKQRKDWVEKRPQIRRLLEEGENIPWIRTKEEFLSQRVLIPCLSTDTISARTGHTEERSNCKYPPKIFKWDEFEQNVLAFNPEGPLSRKKRHLFQTLEEDAEAALSDENGESRYLTSVLIKLRGAGLFSEINFPVSGIVLGKPDWFTLNQKKEVSLVVEMKSTHNLPLPMNADRLLELYKIGNNGKPKKESRPVSKPIGQLVGQMIANNCRYGVLSSGTRSYFVNIKREDAESNREVLFISDAWFIGQKNFLRAWAYMNNIANAAEKVPFKEKIEWKGATGSSPQAGTPEGDSKPQADRGSSRNLRSRSKKDEGDSKPQADRGSSRNLRSRSRNDGSSRKKGKTRSMKTKERDCAEETSNFLPEIEYDALEMIRPLGHGRCGTVILAKWQGQEVALKQFDMEKNYKQFEREVAAYQYLKPAWGSLVVTPLFVCEHWYGWIKYIGLQLGRDPKPDDDPNYSDEREKVLDALEKEYNFRHEDADDGRNMVYIWDEKSKTERLVAIDLEWHTILEP